MSHPGFRLGYNTNGFAHHRLADALRIVAELGYRAVAITPDVHHLPPGKTTAAELRDTRALLDELDLAVIVETGARYVLDPRRKHRPNLFDAEPADRERRIEFLVECARMAAELGGDTISIWSGVQTGANSRDEAWRLLVDGVDTVCRRVEPLGIRVAFEPEPGMLAETLADWSTLRDTLRAPNLGLALDVGHVPCTERIPAHTAIREHAAELLTVHLDDTRGGVHEHLQIGEGELDWPGIARALHDVDFAGIASIELSRHSHAAPTAARDAIRRLSEYFDLPTTIT